MEFIVLPFPFSLPWVPRRPNSTPPTPTPVYTVAAAFRNVMDPAFAAVAIEQHIKQRMRRLPYVVTAVVSMAGTGKSTLLNALGAVTALEEVNLVVAGGGHAANGQHTLVPKRIALLSLCLRGNAAAAVGCEYFIRDLVGYRSQEELRLNLLGKLKNNERYPEGDTVRIAAIANRPVPPMDSVACVIMVIPAGMLLDPSTSMAKFEEMKAVAQRYTANTPDGTECQLPIIPVITKVDLWANAQVPPIGPEALLHKEGGKLKPLFDALQSRLGFPPNDALAIGWLNTGSIDYGNPLDPRVVVLKRLLCQSTDTASAFLVSNGLAEL